MVGDEWFGTLLAENLRGVEETGRKEMIASQRVLEHTTKRMGYVLQKPHVRSVHTVHARRFRAAGRAMVFSNLWGTQLCSTAHIKY